jgi:hypothetical protein
MSIEWNNDKRPSMDELCKEWLLLRQWNWTYVPCENWEIKPTFSDSLIKLKVEEEKEKVCQILK